MGHKKPVRIDPLTVALPPGGADSHAHLDSEDYDANRDEVIARAAKVGVTYIGNVFLSPGAYRAGKDYFADYPNIFFLLGIHPQDGASCGLDTLAEIEEIAKNDSRVAAIGEIGLDYFRDPCPKELQLQTFAKQVELAKKLDKPIVIHCRDAEEDCLTLLEAGGFKDYPLLWHCFGGDARLAKRLLHNGWSISIPGPVTYPANSALREAVAIIPRDKLLIETDCPYLSPVPWRGTTNEPAYLPFTGRAVASARGVDPEELWLNCGDNAVTFFGLNR
ncbi:MAG: TatD family hydrolase [Desulfovibrio sp.]|nr:TatD family hydrolase [Desulfovibrio sp.]